MESQMEDYASADINLLFDDNVATCLDLNDYWTYLPMTTVRSARVGVGSFAVTISVLEGIASIMSLTTKVFVSKTGISSAGYYDVQEQFDVCPENVNFSFDCECLTNCSVYIQFRFKGMQDVGGTAYSVCEIDFP